MTRRQRVELLLDHYGDPRRYGVLSGADAAASVGNPECGGWVTVYLKTDGFRVEDLSFEGEGDTITIAGASLLMELVLERGLTLDEVLELSSGELVAIMGRDIVGRRTKNAALALGALKTAVREYRRARLSGAAM
ncbi:iron-sulfur cluster assembly scaffold protein [Rubrobacter taiwanensis]|jgi:nitrogen fixation NifU-like protein|uniref:Iron-sulfur cluster assembly scaffold protein n=1 Tax=Rubrobacter taiwanensis TaxID=185139 RepID=A0A4R1BGS2_9ACTN|nr:iron-sulfur cluster assembly scaffold protein [Rubrobacter taiwanensis]TCJ16445.1 iron-sulfur cluster assembly scaffold protein [Rubrobacter taiwanensis]